MGGSCCKSSADFEIKFKQTNTFTNRIKYNSNNIKINIVDSSGFANKIEININWTFKEIKKKYCDLIKKNDNNKLIFVYKSKVIEENSTPISMGIDKEITIYSFDGNDYNT